MEKLAFQKLMNHEIVVSLDGVDGKGNIVWHSASNSWHIVWKETGPNPKMQNTSLSDHLISEIEVIGNNLVLVHRMPQK